MTARAFLLTIVAALMACEPGLTPIEPSGSELEALVGLPALSTSEEFELRPRFSPRGGGLVTEEFRLAGSKLAIHVRTEHDAVTRSLTFAVSVENATAAPLWRPLRVELVGVHPVSAVVSNPDAMPATWDYSQQIPVGVLDPGHRTSNRTIAFQLQGNNTAALHSFVARLRVTSGAVNPGWPPQADRAPTVTEMLEGVSATMLWVRYSEGKLSDENLARINLEGGLAGQDYEESTGSYVAHVLEASALEGARAYLMADVKTEWVRDVRAIGFSGLRIAALPTGAFENQLAWYLNRFDKAWFRDESSGLRRPPGTGVRVAIIDTGVDREDTDLKDQVVKELDARLLGGDLSDKDGHGTSVASIIAAASDGLGVVGGAYGAKIVSIKASEAFGFWSHQLAKAFQLVKLEKPDILNMSFVSPDVPWSGADAELQALYDAGTLLVAAAGNCRNFPITWPARHSAVIAVGATDATPEGANARWSGPLSARCGGFSLGSPSGAAMELVAPTPVRALGLDGQIGFFGGTSASAPQVAAMAAILKARAPTLSSAALRDTLVARHVLDLGAIGRDLIFGHGRLIAMPTLSGVTLTDVSLNSTSLTLCDLGPPCGTFYTATVTNNMGATLSTVSIQGWVEQGTAKRAAGGRQLYECGDPAVQPFDYGVLLPGPCQLLMFGSIVPSNTGGGWGTLVPGPATAVIEVQVYNSALGEVHLLTEVRIPITLAN